jgi:uncharacterized protein YecT (DUF1311 family)
MSRIIALAAAGMALVPQDSPAAAAAEPIDVQAHYSETFTACLADALATADRVFCIAAEAQRAEPALEKALEEALNRLSPKRRTAFRSAQAEWRSTVRAKCDSEVADEEFERVAQANRGQCMLDETIRRTIELEGKR